MTKLAVNFQLYRVSGSATSGRQSQWIDKIMMIIGVYLNLPQKSSPPCKRVMDPNECVDCDWVSVCRLLVWVYTSIIRFRYDKWLLAPWIWWNTTCRSPGTWCDDCCLLMFCQRSRRHMVRRDTCTRTRDGFHVIVEVRLVPGLVVSIHRVHVLRVLHARVVQQTTAKTIMCIVCAWSSLLLSDYCLRCVCVCVLLYTFHYYHHSSMYLFASIEFCFCFSHLPAIRVFFKFSTHFVCRSLEACWEQSSLQWHSRVRRDQLTYSFESITAEAKTLCLDSPIQKIQ